jgi:pantoate--beta-alanine ligase
MIPLRHKKHQRHMQVIETIADLRCELSNRPRVTLVPTMGNLHAGHLSLIQLAQNRADPVLASIFVNPLQFAPHEDFNEYPRTLQHDLALLEKAGCDLVFAPSEQQIYPKPQVVQVIPQPALASILEGAVRPGFFTGVSTVVLKLFNMVRPTAAVFGKKDYQQLLVIRQMVEQLALPIDIIAGETIREPHGLALSSRNGYLTPIEHQKAGQLNAVLRQTATAARTGQCNFTELERMAYISLAERGWQPDYIAIRRRIDLGEPSIDAPIVVLGAARLGKTRLIDNVEL